MSFRTRLALAALVVAWVPVLGLGLLVRSVGARRLAEANDLRMGERGQALAAAWGEDLRGLGDRLDALARLLVDENDVRATLRTGTGPGLHDALAGFASASGLGVACILDTAGTILAASHFPGDVGRRDPGLAALADGGDGPVVAEIPLPRGDVTAVLRTRRIEVGGFEVVAVVGMPLTELDAVPAGGDVWLLARAEGEVRGGERVVGGQGGVPPESTAMEGRRRVATVRWRGWGDDPDAVPVELFIAWRDPVLAAMVRSWDRALLLSLAGSAVLALLLGRILARRLSGPVERLAATARGVHLGRLDTSFASGGGRELDRLAFFLNGMLGRIRDGIVRVRDAEKRATVGELARQVNHDVRNGLVPIRNVLDHLGEAHRVGPADLAGAFAARSRTLVESLAYLDDLADQYGAVAVHGARERADLREVVRAVVASYAALPAGVHLEESSTGTRPAWVEMDGVSLRRVVENLVANAVTAVAGKGGRVVVALDKVAANGSPGYHLTVSDDGPGIPPELHSRVFEPFFTTRPGGTGLGLAIARRLVTDVGGRIVLESGEERGTRVQVILRSPDSADSSERKALRGQS